VSELEAKQGALLNEARKSKQLVQQGQRRENRNVSTKLSTPIKSVSDADSEGSSKRGSGVVAGGSGLSAYEGVSEDRPNMSQGSGTDNYSNANLDSPGTVEYEASKRQNRGTALDFDPAVGFFSAPPPDSDHSKEETTL
jgi:hypothetical protein